MHCSSPARIAWAASITALSPDPHTLLMVSAGTVPGRPAWIRAGPLGHDNREGVPCLLVPAAAPPDGVRTRLGRGLPPSRHVGGFLQLAGAEPVVEGLFALGEMRANARRAQPLV